MRYFRHLPPLLRVVSILGWLFFLAAIALSGFAFVTNLSSYPQSLIRVQAIAINLLRLGVACISAVDIYSTRFRQPDRRPSPLSSWPSQLWFIAVVAALSICSLVLAVVSLPTAGSFAFVFPIWMLALVLLAVTLVVNTGG
jgi:hypothetical protein